MANPLFNRDAGLESPAWTAAAVTPSDGADLPQIATRSLYIGGDGNLVVTMSGGGSNVTFVGLVAGTILPIRVDRVLSTSTTATNIVALY